MEYLSFLDYIFLGLCFITLIIIFVGLQDNSLQESTGVLLVIVILYYFNHISDGIYNAKIVKINNTKIGKNTTQNKSFEFYISSEKLKINNHIFFKENNTLPIIDLYINKYKSKDGDIIVITKMGTITMKNKKTKTIIEIDK